MDPSPTRLQRMEAGARSSGSARGQQLQRRRPGTPAAPLKRLIGEALLFVRLSFLNTHPQMSRFGVDLSGVLAEMQADSCIPGIKMTDVMDAAPVLLDEAHRMRDPTFQRRVLYWKTLSGADLKSACQTNRCPTTGNKSVLSLRLALKDLPAVVPAPTPKAAGKRKADGEASAEPKPKAPKTPKPPNELATLKSSKAALAKADADDLAVIKTADLKKSLNAHVKSLAATVNADWHDSYEETAEEACVWFGKAGKAVEAALRVAGEGVALDQCHEALKLVADTWSNINAIPFRSDVGDDVSNVDTSIDVDLGGEEYADYGLISPEALLGLAWPVLLARAASDKSVADAALLRMIKDAVDNGVAEPHVASWEETEREAFVGPSVKSGRARVAALFTGSKSKWSALASTKKKHKMRNAIDRRFDGPKHLRTRHYPSDSDEEGCILM